jgi:hypothetical protein
MQNIEQRLAAIELALTGLIDAHNGAVELLVTAQAFIVPPLTPQALPAVEQAPAYQQPVQQPEAQAVQYQAQPLQQQYPQQALQQQQPVQYAVPPQQAAYVPPVQPQQQAGVTHEALQGLFMAKYNEGKAQGLQTTLGHYGVRTVAELPVNVLQDVFNQVVGL